MNTFEITINSICTFMSIIRELLNAHVIELSICIIEESLKKRVVLKESRRFSYINGIISYNHGNRATMKCPHVAHRKCDSVTNDFLTMQAAREQRYSPLATNKNGNNFQLFHCPRANLDSEHGNCDFPSYFSSEYPGVPSRKWRI